MGSRVLSLWLPCLAFDRIGQERRAGARAEGPRATVAETGGEARLAALCPLAERAGLEVGMALDAARARVPGLKALPCEPARDAAHLRTLSLWCERYTPWVAIDRSHEAMPGGALWLDIASSAHRFGGEARLLADLLGRLRRQGVTVRAAIADHPAAAWAICRHGAEQQRILPVNGARVALAPLPVAALRLGAEQVARLASFGLDRIEHLYPLPRAALLARLGEGVVIRLDQALGLIDEPIGPHAPLPAQQSQMIFAEPVTTCEALPPLIDRLLRQLGVSLEAAGLGARRLTLALYRVDNSTLTLSIGSDRPCRDLEALARRLTAKALALDPGFGIERMILDAVEIEPLLGRAVAWRGLGTGEEPAVRDLAPAAERRSPDSDPTVTRMMPPAIPLPARRPPRLPAFNALATAFELETEAIEAIAVQETPPPPLRLLRRPEPIEAIAPLPDAPPMLFRWRQGVHRIVRAQGPERIAPEWWRMPEDVGQAEPRAAERPGRDYFAVEDSEGDRFWLFREGRYGTSPDTLPRWFLHGLFG